MDRLIEEHREFTEDLREVKLAAFLERASIAAYQVVEAKKGGLVGETLDKARAKREHWLNQVAEVSNG